MKRLLSLLFIVTICTSCLSKGEPTIDPINQLPSMLGQDIEQVRNTFTNADYKAFAFVTGSSSEQETCFSRITGEVVLPRANDDKAVNEIATLFAINPQDSEQVGSVFKTYNNLLKGSYAAKLTSAYITLDGEDTEYDDIDEFIEAIADNKMKDIEAAGAIYSATVEGQSLTLEVPYFKGSLYVAASSPLVNYYSGVWFKL